MEESLQYAYFSALHIVVLYVIDEVEHKSRGSRVTLLPASCDAGKKNSVLGKPQ
jgi:hypothetical protein